MKVATFNINNVKKRLKICPLGRNRRSRTSFVYRNSTPVRQTFQKPPCVRPSIRPPGSGSVRGTAWPNRSLSSLQCRLMAVSSTDRCNTFGKPFSRRLIKQGFPWSLIELPCNGAELGLAMQGKVGATRKILAQQPVSVFV